MQEVKQENCLTPTVTLTNFFTALNSVMYNAENIRRSSWDDQDCFATLHDGKLQLFKNNAWWDWVITELDLYASNWVSFSTESDKLNLEGF